MSKLPIFDLFLSVGNLKWFFSQFFSHFFSFVLGPRYKDTTCKEDFRNGTFVTLKWKYFSKPLHMLNNQTNQIVCYDQPLKLDQPDCVFDHTLNVSGDTNLFTIQSVALCLSSTPLIPSLCFHIHYFAPLAVRRRTSSRPTAAATAAPRTQPTQTRPSTVKAFKSHKSHMANRDKRSPSR